MEKFNVISYRDEGITFSSVEDLEKASDLIKKEENFIVTIIDENKSVLVISNTISSKVENGDYEISAEVEEPEEE